jgi:quaternary ammonium compound-resistance protein SugE
MTSFTPTANQAWGLLLVAGLLEVGWAVGMRYTDGFTRWAPTVAVLAGAGVSFWLLALAMKTLPVGTAYAAWVGIGATGAALLGMWLLAEPATAARFACIALIVAGVVGLKMLG